MQNFSALLNENISQFQFITFDTETTGVIAGQDHIVEIAAHSFDEDFDQRKFQTLVKPNRPIPESVIAIHGITNTMVADAPDTKNAMQQFKGFLDSIAKPRILIAHNAAFDVAMLHGDIKNSKAQADGDYEIVLDHCLLAKVLHPDLPKHRLEFLAQHFGVSFDTLHRANEDVRVMTVLFKKFLSQAADRISLSSSGFLLKDLLNLTGAYFRLSFHDSKIWNQPFCLSPRLAAIEDLCGTQQSLAICYEDDWRTITPLKIEYRSFKLYIKALCHRDEINKTFRADKISAIKL